MHSLSFVNVVYSVCILHLHLLCDDVITSHVISHQLTIQCRQKKRAPCGMYRGSAATDGRFVYIAPAGSTSIYQYECSSEKWMELSSCPYLFSGLAIIDSELTTVGGYGDGADPTNKLFTLRQGKWLRQRKWVEVYPPMNTARTNPAVVSTSDGDYLIAIGGFGSDGWTATVELFQVKSRRWYKLTDLPQPLYCPSATICGDQLHVIGNDRNGYSCSLQSNDRPITSPLTLSWKPLPPLPVTGSTAATLCGQLVLIGGWQRGLTVNSIHQLVEGQWVEIGSMTSDRKWCLAVSPSPDRILIVGGWREDTVEECVAV